LERSEEILGERRRIYDHYRAQLADVRGLTLQPRANDVEIGPWLFSILVDEDKTGVSRDQLTKRLDEAGIETRPFFIPLHRLPSYEAAARARGTELPVTDQLADRGINLPTFAKLSAEQVRFICDHIKGALQP
jgi:perosamine synthetase